jgi:hypothetical protein
VTVTPAAGQTGASTITLTVNDGTGGQATSTFVVTVNAPNGPVTFASAVPIAIPSSGMASPYPSTLTVSGLLGTVSKVSLRLNGFGHTYPSDVDVLVMGPGGQTVLVMSDSGAGIPVSGVNLVLDDAATLSLPDVAQVASGTYKPTNYGAGDLFMPPAPAAPYGAALSDFVGSNPNGTWSLYVMDDSGGDAGSIAGGWAIDITSTGGVAPADVGLTVQLAAVIPTAGEGIHLVVSGQVGSGFVLEYSTDLTTWTELQRGTLSVPSVEIVDGTQPRPPLRFYRLRGVVASGAAE